MPRRSALWDGDPTVKPPFGAAEIDWTHPLAASHVFLPPNEWVSQTFAGVPTAESAPYMRATRQGLGLTGDGTDDILWWNASPLPSQDPASALRMTWLVEFLYTSGAGYGDRFAAFHDSAGVSYWAVGLNNDAGANTLFTFYNGTDGSSVGINPATTYNDGLPHTFMAVGDGPASTLRYYVDGVSIGTSSVTGYGGLTANRFSLLGNYDTTSSAFCPVDIIHAATFPRILSAGDALWLHAEPYAMLRPLVRRRYFIPAPPVVGTTGKGANRRSFLWSGDPTVKPPFGVAEIDWGHLLAQGLGALWLLNEPGGSTAFDATGVCHATAVNSPSRRAGGRGVEALLASASSQYFDAADPPALTLAQNFSIFVSFILTSNSGPMQLIAKDKESGGRNYAFDISTSLRFYGGGADGISSGTALSAGTPYASGVTVGATASTVNIYENSVRTVTNGTLSNTFPLPTATAKAQLGRREYAGNNDLLDGALRFVAVWNTRVLSYNDVRWVTAEPYAMLRPIVRRRYFVPAAAAAQLGDAYAHIIHQSRMRTW